MTNPARNSAQGANKSATRDIVVEEVLPYPPERVWKALTTAELIGQWLMPNDFEPMVGKCFTFKTRPIGDWDGVVQCEVLEVAPPQPAGLFVAGRHRFQQRQDQLRLAARQHRHLDAAGRGKPHPAAHGP